MYYMYRRVADPSRLGFLGVLGDWETARLKDWEGGFRTVPAELRPKGCPP